MSSPRFSAMDWLQVEWPNTKPSSTGYTNVKRMISVFTLSPSDLLKNKLAELKDGQSKKSAIQGRNDEKQNVLHLMLKNRMLYSGTQNIAFSNATTDDLKPTNEENQLTYSITEDYISVSENIYAINQLNAYRSRICQKLKSKPLKDVNEEQLPLLLHALISPFDNDNDEFCDLLLQKDKSGNTPLHYAYNPSMPSNALAPLLDRLQKIPNDEKNPHKKEIAIAKDKQQGKNIFHYMAEHTKKELEKGVAAFGIKIAQVAMTESDNDKMTALHIAIHSESKGNERIAKVQSICEVLKPANEPSAATITQAFQQNKSGLNPLHLACQLNDAKEAQQIVATLKKTLGPGLFAKKLLEIDKHGRTPLDYLIEKSHFDVVFELLKTSAELTTEEQHQIMADGKRLLSLLAVIFKEKNAFQLLNQVKAILGQNFNKNLVGQDKHGLTALHMALHQSNSNVLMTVVNALDPVQIYLIRKKFSDSSLKKYMHNWFLYLDYPDGSYEYYVLNKSRLFDIVDYALNRKRYYNNKDNEFKKQFNAVKEYIKTAEDGRPCLPMKSEEPFYKLSCQLQHVTPSEARACKAFFVQLKTDIKMQKEFGYTEEDLWLIDALFDLKKPALASAPLLDANVVEQKLNQPELKQKLEEKEIKLQLNYDNETFAHHWAKRIVNGFSKTEYEKTKDTRDDADWQAAHIFRNKNGNTPLLELCALEFHPVARLSDLKNIANDVKSKVADELYLKALFQSNLEGLNPFHQLCKFLSNDNIVDLQAIRELRKLAGKIYYEKLLERDNLGLTPLDHAIKANQIEIVFALLQTDDFLTVEQQKEVLKGSGLLHALCQTKSDPASNNVENVNRLKVLLGRNYPESVLEKDAQGRLPLHYAIESNNIEMVKTLLRLNEEGIEFNETQQRKMLLTPDNKGETPLHTALRCSNTHIIRELIDTLGSTGLYLLRKSTKPLELHKESIISPDDYKGLMQKINTRVFDFIDYFIERKDRFTKSDDTDFHARFNKAKEYLKYAEAKQEITPDPKFKRSIFAPVHQAFYDLSEKLNGVTADEAKQCKNFFMNLPKDEEALKLLKLNKEDCTMIAALYTVDAPLSTSKPSAPDINPPETGVTSPTSSRVLSPSAPPGGI